MNTPPRARPPFKPQALECRNCGAPLVLKDDRARMRVCEHCGAILELTATEQKVLGSGAKTTVPYALRLGERVTIGGVAYEVLARICYVEDADSSNQTHEYYLYHPTRRPIWLDVYAGQWSISWRTRLRPQQPLFGAGLVTTYDGAQWSVAECGVYEVHHVEGSLPFVLQAGDRIDYADATNRGETYGAERTHGEIEYSRGRVVGSAELAQWRGMALPRAGPTSNGFAGLGPAIVFSVCAAILIGGIFIGRIASAASGTPLFIVRLRSEQLTGEALTTPFRIPNDDTVVCIELDAPLENEWMVAHVALVESDRDTVVHVDEVYLDYYHGYEYGEHWSEGTKRKRVYFRLPRAGEYRLLIDAAMGLGESELGARGRGRLTARVTANRAHESPLQIALTVMIGIAPLLGALVVGVTHRFGRRRAVGVVATGLVLLLCTGGAGTALAVTGALVAPIEHPEGISIRQSSVGGGGFFSTYDDPRSFQSGGIHAGK